MGSPRGHGRLLRALLLASLLPSLGCAGVTGRLDVGSWFEARGADLMDTVGVRAGVGVGLGAYVRATKYVQLGFMQRGPAERELVGGSESSRSQDFQVRALPTLMFGTIGRYGGLWLENSRELMLPGWSNRGGPRSPIQRSSLTGVVSPDGSADDWEHEVAVGLHVILLGAEVGVRPWQIVDFFAGLIGYDPSGDDVPVDEGEDGVFPDAFDS
jgi:hypothetical protein